MNIQDVINLIEMMAKTNLGAWEEGTKIKHDSYMKGKGDAYIEMATLLKKVNDDENGNY